MRLGNLGMRRGDVGLRLVDPQLKGYAGRQADPKAPGSVSCCHVLSLLRVPVYSA